MTDNLAELLYMAWRSALLSSSLTASDDLPSWGNVRDPDVRAAWEAAAVVARREMRRRCARDLRDEVHDYGALDATANLTTRWSVS